MLMSNEKEEKPNVDLYYSISITLLGLINYSEDHIEVNDTGNLKMNKHDHHAIHKTFGHYHAFFELPNSPYYEWSRELGALYFIIAFYFITFSMVL